MVLYRRYGVFMRFCSILCRRNKRNGGHRTSERRVTCNKKLFPKRKLVILCLQNRGNGGLRAYLFGQCDTLWLLFSKWKHYILCRRIKRNGGHRISYSFEQCDTLFGFLFLFWKHFILSLWINGNGGLRASRLRATSNRLLFPKRKQFILCLRNNCNSDCDRYIRLMV